jgi:hypothetical protein
MNPQSYSRYRHGTALGAGDDKEQGRDIELVKVPGLHLIPENPFVQS